MFLLRNKKKLSLNYPQKPSYLELWSTDAKMFSSNYLVISSDDNDSDTSMATVLDRINHFFSRRVQHTHNTDKGHVCLKYRNSV